MVYKCAKCKRTVEIDHEHGGIRCPYCGYKVLLKERGTIIKRVKAE
ncbi:MAG: DNA-directed RNA polymerase subunit P [Methanocellales archaeon]|nr:DNA-directed RNA polymerase subunit P [Methanocellales archaeon]